MSENKLNRDNAYPGDVFIMKDGRLHKCVLTFCSKLSKYVFAEHIIAVTDVLKKEIENGTEVYKMGDIISFKNDGHNDIVLTVVDDVGACKLIEELLKLSREVLIDGFQRLPE